jgi:hypothetical protein
MQRSRTSFGSVVVRDSAVGKVGFFGLERTLEGPAKSRAVPDRRMGAATRVARRFMVPDTVTVSWSCTVAKAPARGGGRALRGGACRALIPRRGCSRNVSIRPQSASVQPRSHHRKGLEAVARCLCHKQVASQHARVPDRMGPALVVQSPENAGAVIPPPPRSPPAAGRCRPDAGRHRHCRRG